MHPDHLVRSACYGSDFRDGDGGGIGSKESGWGAELVKLAEEILLDGVILCRRLNDKIGLLASLLQVKRWPDSCKNFVLLRLLERSLFDLAIEIGSYRKEGAIQKALLKIVQENGEPVLCEDMRNTVSHRSGTDNRDVGFTFRGHGFIRCESA